MRKLKLQVQMTIDGHIAGPNGEMDWMSFNWDEDIKAYVTDLTTPVDTIIMGRKMAEGFIPYWAAEMNNKESQQMEFAVKMSTSEQVVFTKTLETSPWESAKLATGDLKEEINELKNKDGGDIIVYGGAELVSNLIKEELIDDLHLFINPTAIGNGLSIFKDRTNLKLVGSTAFECGIVVMHYQPTK